MDNHIQRSSAGVTKQILNCREEEEEEEAAWDVLVKDGHNSIESEEGLQPIHVDDKD
jgi:hypothetical protein